MRFRRQTTGDPRADGCDPGAAESDRSCPVRLSILSREALVAILLFGVASYLVSMAQEGTTENQQGKKSLPGHDTLVERVIYAADGRTLISCGWDKRVRFWNVADDEAKWGREIDSLPHNWAIFAMRAHGRREVPGRRGGGRLHNLDQPAQGWDLGAE